MNNYNTNQQGFLLDFESWDANFCSMAASQEGIKLSDQHLLVINFLRDFYKKNNRFPAIRELVKELKKKHGEKIGNSLYLQSLFPLSLIVQAAKLAGLPKPRRCV